MLRAATIGLTLSLSVAACGGESSSRADTSLSRTDKEIQGDAEEHRARDIGPTNTDIAERVDTEELEVSETPQEPFFEVGTNITGANTPDSFTPLIDGNELNIELGFQGLWMVVLAFRTRDVLSGKLTIITKITVDGVVQGELGLAKQQTLPGGQGIDYYYNLFLVVMDPSVAGQSGVIELSVEDAEGTRIEETREVALIGGTSS